MEKRSRTLVAMMLESLIIFKKATFRPCGRLMIIKLSCIVATSVRLLFSTLHSSSWSAPPQRWCALQPFLFQQFKSLSKLAIFWCVYCSLGCVVSHRKRDFKNSNTQLAKGRRMLTEKVGQWEACTQLLFLVTLTSFQSASF